MGCAAALAIALGAIGCGDSSDDGDNGDNGDANASQAQDASNVSGAERQQIAAVMSGLRDSFNAKDGKGFCSKLTPAGQRQMVDYGKRFPGLGNTCVKFMTVYSTRLVDGGGRHKPVRVRKITIDGDKATIDMQGGLAGIRSIATYKLAKANGVWKLTDPVSGTNTRQLPSQYR